MNNGKLISRLLRVNLTTINNLINLNYLNNIEVLKVNLNKFSTMKEHLIIEKIKKCRCIHYER